MKNQLLLISLIVPIISCASLGNKSPAPGDSLVGKWKLIGVKCDMQGKNCHTPYKEMLMEFKKDGMVLGDQKEFGRYTLEGNSFTIKENNSKRTATVEIIHINKYILITREKGYKNTEKLVRVD